MPLKTLISCLAVKHTHSFRNCDSVPTQELVPSKDPAVERCDPVRGEVEPQQLGKSHEKVLLEPSQIFRVKL